MDSNRFLPFPPGEYIMNLKFGALIELNIIKVDIWKPLHIMEKPVLFFKSQVYGTLHCYITTVVNVFWPLGKQMQLAVVITCNPYSHLLMRKLDKADWEQCALWGFAIFVRLPYRKLRGGCRCVDVQVRNLPLSLAERDSERPRGLIPMHTRRSHTSEI